MGQLIIGAILGTLTSLVTSFAVAVFVERMRIPRLIVSIETPPLDQPYPQGAPVREMRSLRVLVHNEAPSGIWENLLERNPALQCRATITFHHLNGQNVLGRSMRGRWSGTPEPVPVPVIGPGGQQFHLFDFSRLTLETAIDIHPGERELLDIANRADNDEECYGWNNETYFSTPPWRNPNWKLSKGRYLVKVIVTSSGKKASECFRLVNDVSRGDFRLEPASDSERDLLATV